MRTRTWMAALLATAAMAGVASAQSNDSRANLANERSAQYFRPDDFALNTQPSDHDIVLMEAHQPWYLVAHGETGLTDNAYLTAPKHSDGWVAGTLDGGFQTTLAESVDVVAGGQVGMWRYAKHSDLDTDSLAAVFSVSKLFGDVRAGVEYVPSVYFGRGFDEQSLLAHDLALFAQTTWAMGEKSQIYAYGRLSRRWSSPDDYENTRLSITTGCQHECWPNVVLTTGITLAYAYYDNYFEDQTDETRQDFLVNPFVSLVYQMNDWSTVGVTLSYARNYSTIDKVDYESAAGSPYVELNWRF